MAAVFDVAKYILEKKGQMTAMKLQKLVYYSQAWSLVWDERPLFPECIQAWANGPVCPDLYQMHRGKYLLGASDINGDSSALDSDARDTVDVVLDFYGEKSAQWLSDLTHSEEPWIIARDGMSAMQRGSREITQAAMAEYYSALT